MSTQSALGNSSFRIYLLGNAVSWLGTWSQRIGIGWLSWDLTHQTFWVGAVSLAQLLPLIILGPLFGVLIDRSEHRRYALVVNTVLALMALALYVLTARQLMTIELLLCMAIVVGIGNSAYQAARLNMVNDIVEPAELPSAIALNSVLYNVARAVGPALAGVLIADFGIAIAFAVNAVSFLAVLGALLIVRLRPRHMRLVRHGLIAESLAGLRYIAGHAGLRQLLWLGAVTAILGRGVLEMMPAYADVVFQRGSVGLAHLTSAGGVGAIAGALLLARLRADRQLVWLTSSATLVLGLVVSAFGFCTAYWLGLLLAGALGFVTVLCGVGLQVRLQTTVTDGYRGRVLGVWTAVIVAGPGLGAAAAGAAAQQLGLKLVTVTAGVVCCALIAWVLLSAAPADAGSR